MHITTYATVDHTARAAARLVRERLRATPDLVIGLPTGATPIAMYRALVRAHRQGHADFSRATTFNLDEFVGLGRGDAGSYHAFMQSHLFAHVNLSPARAHVLDGRAKDWRAEARRYDARIAKAGGLDVVILGIGRNGHIGFNEPGPVLAARTHRATLRPDTRRANAPLFSDRWRDVPKQALSMGIGTILSAREVVLIATGRSKARIVARALGGPITTRVPASLLQAHPNVIVLLDREAAAGLDAGSEDPASSEPRRLGG